MTAASLEAPSPGNLEFQLLYKPAILKKAARQQKVISVCFFHLSSQECSKDTAMAEWQNTMFFLSVELHKILCNANILLNIPWKHQGYPHNRKQDNTCQFYPHHCRFANTLVCCYCGMLGKHTNIWRDAFGAEGTKFFPQRPWLPSESHQYTHTETHQTQAESPLKQICENNTSAGFTMASVSLLE